MILDQIWSLRSMAGRCRKRRCNFRAPGMLAFLFFIFQITSIFCQPAAAYDVPFDSASCKRDPRDNVYVALGRHVFAMPYIKGGNFDLLRPGNVGLRPPDPSESAGCFGNPLQLWTYGFAYRHGGMTGSKVASSPWTKPGPNLVLYRVSDGPTPGSNDPEWPGESSKLMEHATTCRNAAVREELPNGLIACRVKMLNPPNMPQVEWAASYQARPEIYSTPLNKPFVVNCGSLLSRSNMESCDVTYTVKPGLGLSYKFQPYLGHEAIPIDKIIDFDKSARAEIESYLVGDYSWPDQGVMGGEVVVKKP